MRAAKDHQTTASQHVSTVNATTDDATRSAGNMKSWGLRRKSSRASVDGSPSKEDVGLEHARTRSGDGQGAAASASSLAVTTPSSSPVFGRHNKDRRGSGSEASTSTRRSNAAPFPVMSTGKSQKIVLTQPAQSLDEDFMAGSPSKRDKGKRSDGKDTPTKHASPLLIRPRPASVVSLTSTADALGDLSFHSPPQVRRSLDEGGRALDREEQHLSSSPKSKARAKPIPHDSALAHLASTQLRDEKARQLHKSPSMTSLQSAQSDALAKKKEQEHPDASTIETQTAQRTSEADKETEEKEFLPTRPQQASSVPERTPLAGKERTDKASSMRGDEAHQTADSEQEAAADTKESDQQKDEHSKTSHTQERKHVEHESIGDSMSSALQAMKQIHGVAHLDRDESEVDVGQDAQLTYTPRRRRRRAGRDNEALVKKRKYRAPSGREHPQANLQLSLVRARTVASLRFVSSMGKALASESRSPREARQNRHVGLLARVKSRLAGASVVDPYPSTSQGAGSQQLSLPLVRLSVPALLHCNDVIYWTTERASRLAACIVALVGS